MFDNPLADLNIINKKYKYVGPGSNMKKKNRPYNRLDQIAYDHDVAYGKYGKKAYYRYNKADRKFLHDLRTVKRNERDRAYYISKGYFNLKRLIAPKDKIDLSQNKTKELSKMVGFSTPRKRIRVSSGSTYGSRSTGSVNRSRLLQAMSPGSTRRRLFKPAKSSNRIVKALNNASIARGEGKRLKKQFKPKRKKFVKVPTRLKKQIKTVLANDKVINVYGFYQQTFTGDYWGPGSDKYDKQFVDMLPIGTNGSSFGKDSGRNGVLFDPVQLMDVVSILYCKKTPARVPAASNPVYNTPGATGGNFSLLTAGSSLKVEFTQLEAVTYIKNNTHRSMILYWYECQPRAAPRVDALTTQGLIEDWETCLYQDYFANIIGDVAAGGTGPAYRSHSITDLHTTPAITSGWGKMWKCNVTKISLEAGQVYEKVTKGDVGLYDFSKYYQNVSGGGAAVQTFMPVQKTNRYIMIRYVPDLTYAATTVTSTFGRHGFNLTGHAIIFETVVKYKFKMPEVVGLTSEFSTATGITINAPITLNARRRRYGYDTWTASVSGTTSSMMHIDPMDPATDETTLG